MHMRASVWKMSVLILAVAVVVSGQTLAPNSRVMPFSPEGGAVEVRSVVSDDPVTLTRDAQGIWFIEGGSLYDVYEAMGYAVATDRLFQMDVYRRLGRGRLSELLGSAAVGTDWFLRTIGYSDEEYAEMFASLSDDAQTVVYGLHQRRQPPHRRVLRRQLTADAGRVLVAFHPIRASNHLGIPVLPAPWHVNDVMATVMLHLREFDPEGQQDVLGHGQLDNAVLAQTLAAVYGLEGLAMFQDLRWFNDPSAQTMVPIPEGTKSAAYRTSTADIWKRSSRCQVSEGRRSSPRPGRRRQTAEGRYRRQHQDGQLRLGDLG